MWNLRKIGSIPMKNKLNGKLGVLNKKEQKMNDFVWDELLRVHCPGVSSDFEKAVTEDIFKWAAKNLGNDALNFSFNDLAEAFWKEKLE